MNCIRCTSRVPESNQVFKSLLKKLSSRVFSTQHLLQTLAVKETYWPHSVSALNAGLINTVLWYTMSGPPLQATTKNMNEAMKLSTSAWPHHLHNDCPHNPLNFIFLEAVSSKHTYAKKYTPLQSAPGKVCVFNDGVPASLQQAASQCSADALSNTPQHLV